jgi:hypothetical protein
MMAHTLIRAKYYASGEAAGQQIIGNGADKWIRIPQYIVVKNIA